MDCEKQLSLVIYEEDTSKQKSLLVQKTAMPQNNNDFFFSVVSLVTGDTPPLEKVNVVAFKALISVKKYMVRLML